MTTLITADNIDQLLDDGRIEALVSKGKWWRVRRNGATRRWKRDPQRFYVGIKAGMYAYGNITNHNCNTSYYRVAGGPQ